MASTSNSSAVSSIDMSRRNYDVFLSFRGPDCRNTIISHLYIALQQQGVYTFKDNEELEVGQRRKELFDAIEGSRIAVVVFTENYARSKWCLNELEKIIECKEKGKLTVLPIFYHVSPGVVRLNENDKGEEGCYQKAMEAMKAKYREHPKMVERWREALWKGGDLIGIPLGQGQDEGNAVREVVKQVSKQLNRVPLDVAKYPVGIERHLREIRPLLHIDPHVNDVYMVGIHGQGGAGKTTLSKEICNKIAGRFDSSCFLPNVRETTSRDGLAHLQQTLLRKLLDNEDLKVSSVDEGKQLIKERLCEKKVLVILDDVDERNQFDALARNLDWFGSGSRIIITTRNKHVLTSNQVPVYEVKLLKKKEASNLFQLHAFGEMQENMNINGGLIDSFVKYARNLPLALVLLGEFLRGRSESEWKGKLKELAKSVDRDINSVLKISFDGLESDHKEMFLNVACFFKGWKIDDVKKIFDCCDFAASLGIPILVQRCLITVDHGRIQMHDLLEAMGQNIVREESLKDRIWLRKDLMDILSEDRERQAVKGIVLSPLEGLSMKEYEGPVNFNALKDLKKLRVLIFQNVAGPKEPLQLPRQLRWLEWKSCSASAIEFDPSNELVGLDLWLSKIRQIKGKGFEQLKYLRLLRCHFVETLPDLSKCSKLEDLNLSWCENLTSLDEAIGSLENLIHLDLSCCSNLATVPSSLRSKRLQTLDFYECLKLEKLPAIKEELKSLKSLDLGKTAVKELPDSFGNLVALKKLLLSGCKKLTTIPSSIYKLRGLERLDLRDCRKLSQFPRRAAGATTGVLGFPNLRVFYISNCKLMDLEFLNDLTCFETLNYLYLSGNEFTHVPACIRKFKNLKGLWLCRCDRLVEVPELPNVSHLSVAECRGLKSFLSLHTFICRSPKWFHVDLSNCHSLGSGYVDRLLSLEKVRGFVGAAKIVCPGTKFPDWVTFQNSEYDSRHQVSLPLNISEDDLLGLALFVSFEYVKPVPCYYTLNVRIDGELLSENLNRGGVGVHTWFLYIPRQSHVGKDSDFTVKLNWHKFTLKFSREGAELRKWGMRLLCKREQDDNRIEVSNDGDDESYSSGAEYESAVEGHSSGSECESVVECVGDTDYESVKSELGEQILNLSSYLTDWV